jgi:YfiH family protein
MSRAKTVDGYSRRIASTLETLGLAGYRAVRVKQVHGNKVIVVDGGEQSSWVEADGMVTRNNGVALVTVHADCFPVFFLSTGAVGLVHSGWRGVMSGVVSQGLKAMLDLGVTLEEMWVVFGPGVGPCCYSFGQPGRAEFSQRFGSGVVQGDRVDLYMAMVVQLLKAGVPRENIGPRPLCTSCNWHLFFSHRREAECGRFAAIAALL